MTPAARASLSALVVLGCHGHASSEDCAKIREHYIALVTSADPAVAKMTPDQQKVAREMTMELRTGEKSWKKASTACEAKVTSKQAECALAAPNADAWETCLADKKAE
jgi:hypothetical protein